MFRIVDSSGLYPPLLTCWILLNAQEQLTTLPMWKSEMDIRQTAGYGNGV